MQSYTATKTTTAELIAAPGAGYFIRVWGYRISGQDTEATCQLRSAATPKETILTPETGVGGFSVPIGREPLFDCAINEALNFNSGGVTGTFATNISYTIVP